MEPQREEQKPQPQPRTEEKPKRFRLIRLEERIAPGKGGNGSQNCAWSAAKDCVSHNGGSCVSSIE
jgi:hypothetical protein